MKSNKGSFMSCEGVIKSSRRLLKMLATIAFEGCVVTASYILALLLRFDGSLSGIESTHALLLLPALLVLKLVIFLLMGTSKGWWRYVSLPDAVAILRGNLVATLLVFTCYVLFYIPYIDIPVSVLLVDGLLCYMIMTGSRVIARLYGETFGQHRSSTCQAEIQGRVIVVGAGAAGQTIVREIRQNPHLDMNIIGFIDNDPQRLEQKFQGVPVLGLFDDLENVCCLKNADMVIITQPAASRKELLAILDVCRKLAVKSKILPSVGEILNEEVSICHVRDVQLEDLLGRKPVHLDVAEIKGYIQGKRVLVTGAGGSIGSDICRQVIAFSPESIVLFDNAETPLFNIENELKRLTLGVKLIPSLSDVRDRQRVHSVFSVCKPEVVFHAAAYKHVPMLETHPAEAVSTNVLGTRNLADAAHASGVERFVMVSTDKAVNPANVMGASKRAAEIYVQFLARKSSTVFSTVRFGNVLGSNGSVIPIFKDQIAKGGPITVTHPEIVRFFMTISEAAQLVLQAGSMGRGCEIFLLDMGEPIKILDLAEELIRLSGLRPYEDIDITFTGLRPGEKLFEELLLAGEDVTSTAHDKIFMARSNPIDSAELVRWIEEISRLLHVMDSGTFVSMLKRIVPEYGVQPPGPAEAVKTTTNYAYAKRTGTALSQ
jgi:FlaA1/EpsC-like NDP-sugar epimerase